MTRDIRAPSADRHETLPHVRYLGAFYNLCPKIAGPPQNIWGQKHAKFEAILHNFRIWSRVSPERVTLSKIGKICDRERFLPRSAKEVLWTLVHYSEIRTCEFGRTQIDFFGRLLTFF